MTPRSKNAFLVLDLQSQACPVSPVLAQQLPRARLSSPVVALLEGENHAPCTLTPLTYRQIEYWVQEGQMPQASPELQGQDRNQDNECSLIQAWGGEKGKV